VSGMGEKVEARTSSVKPVDESVEVRPTDEGTSPGLMSFCDKECAVCIFYQRIWGHYSDGYNKLTSSLVKGEITKKEYRKLLKEAWRKAEKGALKELPHYRGCPMLSSKEGR